MSARLIIGPVTDVLRSMPAGSVDLVMTSPPFLSLRSYLAGDHPDKAKEIGNEPNPGAYIDSLIEVTEELARVLSPTGSLCFELGDTYSGSGGAGGDYGPDGMHAGQPVFRQTKGDEGWPELKSLCLIPELYRIALVYGVNALTGRQTAVWRARNVVRWARPNPSPGALSDKFRPSTSDMVIACKSRNRYFDLDAVRTPLVDPDGGKRRDKGSSRVDGLQRPSESIVQNPAGGPPLDTWEPLDEERELWDQWADQVWRIPTAAFKGSHYATFPPALCVRPILAMCPPGGTVLDPFAGSGTTLAVATGHGRNAIGIDLDERNEELVRQRVGMFLDPVEHYGKAKV